MDPHGQPRQKISIVTPCFNEEGTVRACSAEVARVMRELLPDYDYEHLFCDNSSTDGTLRELRELAAHDHNIKVIVNSRNVGPFRNMANGLRNVSGDLVIPMVPADLQDPPDAIPRMVAKLLPDVDVVYGVRANRREGALMRFARNAYYSTLRAGGARTSPAHAGEFMLVRREIIASITSVADSHPYIRGLVAQVNPRFETVQYTWAERKVGRSRNSLAELIDQAINGIVATVRRPIRWALFLGILMALAGGVVAIVYLAIFVFRGSGAAPGIPTLIVATFLFGGINLFFTGLVGEYVLSIHAQVRPEPPMFERERINF